MVIPSFLNVQIMEKRLQYIAEDINTILDKSEISVQTEADRENIGVSIARAGTSGRVVYVKDTNKRYKYVLDTQTWVEITTKTVVDDKLDNTSENPVQNKVITNRITTIEASVASNTTSISTLTTELGKASDRINANSGSISALEDTVDTKENKPTYLTYSIPASGWTELTDKNSYKYQAMITTSYTIADNTEIEIVVDDLSLYSKYGFGVGQVEGLNVYIWAIGKPDTEVTIMVGFRG